MLALLLRRYGSPDELKAAGTRRVDKLMKPLAPRMAERLAQEIAGARGADGRSYLASSAATVIIPSLAPQLSEVPEQRRMLEGQFRILLGPHPLSQLLISMPGIGVRTAVTILTAVGDGSTFPTADHLAADAGLAPATKPSGSSIRGEHAPRRANRQLKRR